MSGRLVLLTIDTDIGRISARRLAARFPDLEIVVEDIVSRWTLLKNRTKRFGVVHVAGQLGFMAYSRVLGVWSRRRIDRLKQRHGFDDRWPDGSTPHFVPSVNSDACIERLKAIAPSAVLVVGTRIIGRRVLEAVPVPFINYHAGITPKYRGIHGGYWAKVNGDLENFGVTVHLVDTGIDTGAVLYQSRLTPEAGDNYATFPYLQLAGGLALLERAGQDALDGTLARHTVDLPSRLWSHPTLWGYFASALARGAW